MSSPATRSGPSSHQVRGTLPRSTGRRGRRPERSYPTPPKSRTTSRCIAREWAADRGWAGFGRRRNPLLDSDRRADRTGLAPATPRRAARPAPARAARADERRNGPREDLL